MTPRKTSSTASGGLFGCATPEKLDWSDPDTENSKSYDTLGSGAFTGFQVTLYSILDFISIKFLQHTLSTCAQMVLSAILLFHHANSSEIACLLLVLVTLDNLEDQDCLQTWEGAGAVLP